MSTASSIEQEMLTLINAERTARGLNTLQLETQLNDSSEDHSTWMLNTDTFSHTGSGGSSATQRMEAAGLDLEGNWRTGENIAWQSERGAPGISDDVAQLHQNLMNSPGHRANILNPDFEYIGIGIETGDMQGFDAVMVTQNFAATDAAVMLDNGNTPVPPVPTPPTEEVVEPEEPGTETPDTDVAEPEEPGTETPDTDVAEPEEPGTETPDTDVAEPEEPGTETPDTDVAEPEEPGTETPDTDVAEPEEPGTETPDTDVAEPEEPGTETPDTDVAEPEEPDSGCFDLAAFRAELEAFIEELQTRFDEFDWEEEDMVPTDSSEDDMDVVVVEDTGPVEETVDACPVATEEDTGDTYVFNFYDFGCMMEAA